jgi:hypothetical protein
VSLAELHNKLGVWAEKPENKNLLARFREQAGREVYVRIVSRVYLTRSVTVNMSNSRYFESKGSAGAKKKVELDARDSFIAEGDPPPPPLPVAMFGAAQAKGVENAVTQGVPGGSFKIVQASGRTVTMKETFARPLVVGFLGFDFPVHEGGSLGAPLSTRARLAGEEVRTGKLSAKQEEYLILRQAVEGSDFKEAIYEATAKEIGGEFMTTYAAAKATDGATIAFTATKTGWLVGKSPQELYEREVYDALLKAWREAQ